MKIVMIPDSFKGSISSTDAAFIMKKAALDFNSNDEIILIPIADGGEGTVDCFLEITKGNKLSIEASDLYNNPIKATVCKFENTYIIEVASVVGLTLSKEKDPFNATTYGLGVLINKILDHKPQKIIIGLGGSGTNDAGIGLATALGTEFYDESGSIFTPTILTMDKIVKIDNNAVIEKLKNVEIIGLCDVNNPLCGLNGATYIYGPQKGLSQQDLEIVDNKIYHLGVQIRNHLKINAVNRKGSGAAGGLGAAILGFLNGNLRSGIDVILDLVNFDDLLKDTDYVITGEGKFDSQSLNGKVIQGISKRCKEFNVPVIVLCGKNEINNISLDEYNIKDVILINPPQIDKATAFKNVKTYLLDATNQVMNNIYTWKYNKN